MPARAYEEIYFDNRVSCL